MKAYGGNKGTASLILNIDTSPSLYLRERTSGRFEYVVGYAEIMRGSV